MSATDTLSRQVSLRLNLETKTEMANALADYTAEQGYPLRLDSETTAAFKEFIDNCVDRDKDPFKSLDTLIGSVKEHEKVIIRVYHGQPDLFTALEASRMLAQAEKTLSSLGRLMLAQSLSMDGLAAKALKLLSDGDPTMLKRVAEMKGCAGVEVYYPDSPETYWIEAMDGAVNDGYAIGIADILNKDASIEEREMVCTYHVTLPGSPERKDVNALARLLIYGDPTELKEVLKAWGYDLRKRPDPKAKPAPPADSSPAS